MAEVHYQELNLMQVLDVLRSGGLARLGLSAGERPYVVPVAFQLEVRGARPVLHLASPDAGRKVDILRENALACLEVEQPGAAWFDVVLAEGRAALGAAENGGVEIAIHPETLSGRRFFLTR